MFTVEDLAAPPGVDDPAFPPDWEAQIDAWSRPSRADLAEVVYTSGTTSAPKGVMLTHGTFLSTLEVAREIIPPRHHRIVGILPLSHVFEQAVVLFYGAMLGAEITYVRSLNPRTLFAARSAPAQRLVTTVSPVSTGRGRSETSKRRTTGSVP